MQVLPEIEAFDTCFVSAGHRSQLGMQVIGQELDRIGVVRVDTTYFGCCKDNGGWFGLLEIGGDGSLVPQVQVRPWTR